MHTGKTLKMPGATPLWPAFSRPNLCGVAPGQSPRNGDRVLPACIQRCKQPDCGIGITSNAGRRTSQWQF